MCTSQTITGTIGRIEWANPHIIMIVDASDSTYRIEWMNLRQLAMAGLERDVLLAGDRVVITGTKNRDPNVHIMTLLSEISRPSDGFTWSRPRSRARARPAACDASP